MSLTSGAAGVAVDLDHGARLASLVVGGHELLVGWAASPIDWGCYPMAPWAGRLREGRFSFRGVEYRLHRNHGDHAIHGTVFDAPWEAEGEATFAADFGPGWPFPGFARQRIDLADDGLTMRLEVHATAGEMPAACGWHPWFRRRLAAGGPGDLAFTAGFMEVRNGTGIPTGERRSPPPPGPWDDCFGEVRGPVTIAWPGVLTLEVRSTCDYLVVYDERDHAICVEPQTAPPDALNRTPDVIAPGRPLVAETAWKWRDF